MGLSASLCMADTDCPGGTKVLIVDDSRAQLHLLGAMLRRAGYTIVSASSAEEALAKCADPAIRIVVSDWVMPGMNGPEFCRAFRDLDRGRYGYFILVTSKSEHEERATGLDAGADDFVTRPINWAELRARIRAGERLLDMEDQLVERNRLVQETLSQLERIHREVEQDLQEARKLQQSMLPDLHARFGGCEIDLRLVTCGQIGGDLIGYFQVSTTEIAVFSIDVSGHGIASAMLTGQLASLFSIHAKERNIAFVDTPYGPVADRPADVVARLNAHILSELETDIYFTITLAYVHLRTGAVEYCQAGHPHLIVRRATGAVEIHGDGGPPVGLLNGVEFESHTLSLAAGDRLFLCSDGLTESISVDGEMLHEEGVAKMLAQANTAQGAKTLERIETLVSAYSGMQTQDDDTSMVLLDFQPQN